MYSYKQEVKRLEALLDEVDTEEFSELSKSDNDFISDKDHNMFRRCKAIDQSTGEKAKPEVVSFYNVITGGVDVVDRMNTSYNVVRSTWRWPLVIFDGLMNVVAINAFVVYKANNPDGNFSESRRIFVRNLGTALVKENARQRAVNQSLARKVRELAGRLSGLSAPEDQQDFPLNKRGYSPVETHKLQLTLKRSTVKKLHRFLFYTYSKYLPDRPNPFAHVILEPSVYWRVKECGLLMEPICCTVGEECTDINTNVGTILDIRKSSVSFVPPTLTLKAPLELLHLE
ncbi:piggybac transposable element-derived protein 4 [Holotrichia oblita]|uniref:Piggybac transposable element-derived protein 4 n=1 Tax=Holotrichia oblita TaxID=644536 RepID=A0ACB9SKB3_HOLOL|nr:piggybac transposable element-derived protein 4 [Holotrichia oblita]